MPGETIPPAEAVMAEKKARFVFWGCPSMIEKMVGALKPFETCKKLEHHINMR